MTKDELPFQPEMVAKVGPLLRLELDADGMPVAAVAAVRVAAPPARVWQIVSDVAGYQGVVPMIHKVKRDGDRVTVQLRFRVSLFSVGFEFVADATYENERWLELRWVSGEPRDLRLRFVLEPLGDATVVYTRIGFDVFSLGWLVKYFLKHHPEIQHGIFPGSALALCDSLRRTAEKK